MIKTIIYCMFLFPLSMLGQTCYDEGFDNALLSAINAVKNTPNDTSIYNQMVIIQNEHPTDVTKLRKLQSEMSAKYYKSTEKDSIDYNNVVEAKGNNNNVLKFYNFHLRFLIRCLENTVANDVEENKRLENVKSSTNDSIGNQLIALNKKLSGIETSVPSPRATIFWHIMISVMLIIVIIILIYDSFFAKIKEKELDIYRDNSKAPTYKLDKLDELEGSMKKHLSNELDKLNSNIVKKLEAINATFKAKVEATHALAVQSPLKDEDIAKPKPQVKRLFAQAPLGKQFTEFSDKENTSNSYYILNVDFAQGKGTFEPTHNEFLQQALLNTPEALHNACKYDAQKRFTARSIVLVRPGKISLSGQYWEIEKPAEIDFE